MGLYSRTLTPGTDGPSRIIRVTDRVSGRVSFVSSLLISVKNQSLAVYCLVEFLGPDFVDGR